MLNPLILAVSLAAGQWLAFPFLPPKESAWITAAELRGIIADLDAMPEWKPVAVALAKNAKNEGPWQTIVNVGWRVWEVDSPWVLVDLNAYSQWRGAIAKQAITKRDNIRGNIR